MKALNRREKQKRGIEVRKNRPRHEGLAVTGKAVSGHRCPADPIG